MFLRALNRSACTNDVTLSGGVANYNNKNVGTGKTVTLTDDPDSLDAGNYFISSVTTTTANITALESRSIYSSCKQTYDGNTRNGSYSHFNRHDTRGYSIAYRRCCQLFRQACRNLDRNPHRLRLVRCDQGTTTLQVLQQQCCHCG